MKTLFIYDDTVSSLKYAIVEGDYSIFNGVVINAGLPTIEIESKCSEYLFSQETGDVLIDFSNDIMLVENKQWDKVANITFLA